MREYTEYIKQVSNTPIDVHLMVDNIEPYLKEYVDMEVQAIIFHIESCKNEEEALKWISYLKENNIKFVIMAGWKNGTEVNIKGLALKEGFKEEFEIENFWKEDSLEYNFNCTACGKPPCLCSAVIYTKVLV